MFVRLGGSVLNADRNGIGGLSGEAIRAAPWRFDAAVSAIEALIQQNGLKLAVSNS